MKVAVILGSVRPYRMGPRVGKMVLAELEKRGHQSTLFDPAEIKLPLLEKPLHWHAPNEEKPQILVQTYESLKSHDAFIIVTPEYNFKLVGKKFFKCYFLTFSLPPALTNFIDHFPYDTWRWRFGSIISYSMGNFGGIVAQQQLRTMCGITSLVALPSSLTIPNVQVLKLLWFSDKLQETKYSLSRNIFFDV